MKMGLLDHLGRKAEPQVIHWQPRDTMLYALSVGAGQRDPCTELHLTTECGEIGPLQALPGLAVALIHAAARPPAGMDLPLERQLHAAQWLRLAHPMPAEGEAQLDVTIGEVSDKGTNALVALDCQLTLRGQDRPFAFTRQTIFMRGMGGFGGPRGESLRDDLPERAPDRSLNFTVPANMALLYRLMGDYNSLHCSPTVAAQAGFDRPILHGLCSYGIACRLALVAFGLEPGEIVEFGARMTRPVTPGEPLRLDLWRIAADQLQFQMVNAAGEAVLRGGELRLGQGRKQEEDDSGV